jgi:hypothetical protein
MTRRVLRGRDSVWCVTVFFSIIRTRYGLVCVGLWSADPGQLLSEN